MRNTMAVDQYGNTFHNLGPNPRKELMKRLYNKHAEKMYTDTESGPKHTGYVIAGLWLTIHEVSEWTGGKVR